MPILRRAEMYSFRSSVSAPSCRRKVLASVAVALVLLLSVFAASPTLHGHLHDAESGATLADDSCAVVLFATGVTLVVALTACRPTDRPERAGRTRPAALFVRPPRYLRQPERGPPAI